MAFQKIKQLPTVEAIAESMPVPANLQRIKADRDQEIQDIFLGKSSKLLMLIGPCSAHDEGAVIDYVGRLSKVQEKVKDQLVLLPRIYTNKPRTTGEGYKGMAHQPNPEEAPDVVEGLKAIRRMHIRSLSESGLPAADEMLYPSNYPYLEDLLSYVAVGARSVENQKHRLVASGLDIPVGMKNPTSGDMEVMLNSIRAAQISHVFVYNGYEVKTRGNSLTHAVLRGSMTKHGLHIPNYHYEDLMKITDKYHHRELANPAIIIDTNHSNSGKKFAEQPRIATEVMQSLQYSEVLKGIIKGFMIESYLEEGSQSVSESIYGKSITDPCLGWPASERLLYDIAERLA